MMRRGIGPGPRRRGPGVVGTVARTAVVAGTASAVSGRVARNQAEKYAEQDAATAAQQQAAMAAAAPPPPPPPPPAAEAAPAPAPAGGMTDEDIAKLKELASLHQAGVLTDDEFAVQKAKLLA